MIILIGGSPRTGKSTVSKRLMKQLGLPWVSTDAFGSVASRLLPPAERAVKFPYKGFTSAEQMSEMASEQRLAWQITEAESTKDFVRYFIDFQAGVGEGVIVEGVHLLPSHVREMMADENLRDKLRVTFVLTVDPQVQLAAMKASQSPNDWLSGASDETYRAVADLAVRYSQWLRAECDRYGLPYVLRQGDFAAENERLIASLL
jgi:hypothetical protein